MKRIEVRGVKIYPFKSPEELIGLVEVQKGILVAINAEKILHATDQTRDIINRNIGYCDGVGAVMALKKKGCPDVVKIPGCELWLKIVEAWYRKGKSFYLVGSRPEVIEAAVGRLMKDYPGVVIAGYRDGYIKSEEEKEV